MTETTIPQSIQGLPPPLPQVGAVLHLDTRLPQKAVLDGNRYWKLTGSCVLASPDQVLTIRHVLDRFGDVAVFFPYRGIFWLDRSAVTREPSWTRGDHLVLVKLKGSLGTAPFRHLKVSSFYKDGGDAENVGCAQVCGFGFWPGTPWARLNGLQQRYRVDLGVSCPGAGQREIHYDNLDLIWTSGANHGLVAGLANSGGPILWEAGQKAHPEAEAPPTLPAGVNYSYVGLSRERKLEPEHGCDLQVGSWIGWSRKRWLDKVLPASNGQPLPADQASQVLTIPADPSRLPVTVDFPVPPNKSRVCCTLNASDGLRLQMKLRLDEDAGWLDGIRDDDQSSGRFLRRVGSFGQGLKTLSVGVSTVARAAVGAKEAVAQICCSFE